MNIKAGDKHLVIGNEATTLFGLEEKVALITGGARGIGCTICFTFAANGASIVVADIEGNLSLDIAQKINDSGGRAIAVKADVANEVQVKKVIERTIQEYGRLDILINNAGIIAYTPIEEITEEEWDRIMAVNLKGVFFFSREASKLMKKQGWGRIINIGSIAGKLGRTHSGLTYCVSKAAVMQLTKNFAYHMSPYGITVNAVAPGVIDAGMAETWDSEVKANFIANIPKGRLGTAADVANAVAFLASESADYITGEILDINGGFLMD